MIKRYKRKFICFECRKLVKKPNAIDQAEKNGEGSVFKNAFHRSKPYTKVSKEVKKELALKYYYEECACPVCNSTMRFVPISFEVPPKKDTKAWVSLKSFYDGKEDELIYHNFSFIN